MIAGYEELRRQVLTGCGNGPGMTLFLRHGMRSWMEAWASCHWSAAVAPRRESHPPRPVAVGLHSELAMLLTSMAMPTHPEVSR